MAVPAWMGPSFEDKYSDDNSQRQYSTVQSLQNSTIQYIRVYWWKPASRVKPVARFYDVRECGWVLRFEWWIVSSFKWWWVLIFEWWIVSSFKWWWVSIFEWWIVLGFKWWWLVPCPPHWGMRKVTTLSKLNKSKIFWCIHILGLTFFWPTITMGHYFFGRKCFFC